MIKLERIRFNKEDRAEFIFISPEHVTVIIPRSDTIHGSACDIGLSNATTWAVQHDAEVLANRLIGLRQIKEKENA
jgi:hypothetical protein